ncbi:hypothetical protein [Nocardia vermiculata]|uniref:Uncharacterized protein n=1 Tax=Nocardia vermiculata TaxID=257274 RepID=A0A846Y4W8_9NOCA|nr:hypothetical protein [Nocardia vermiculata]NKY53887.1 hypothetical protein [Nocardia vermiculata]
MPVTNTTTASAVKGLTLHVYRNAAAEMDHTNGGITATATRVTLVGISVEDLGGEVTRLPDWQVSTPTEDAPPVVAVVNRRWNGTARYAFLAPAEIRDNEIQRPPAGRYMFGGNYAATHDSRFRNALSYYLNNEGPDVLRVHDRTEL